MASSKALVLHDAFAQPRIDPEAVEMGITKPCRRRPGHDVHI